MKNRFSKPVALHKVNDEKIINHIEGRNFSRYVKELIIADINKSRTRTAQNGADRGVKMDITKTKNGGLKISVK